MTQRFLINQEEVREWIEERGGVPAVLSGTSEEEVEDESSLLRISFDPNDPDLEEIGWEEFFDRFEEDNLALSYEDEGDPSDFTFVDRSKIGSDLDATPESELPDSQDESPIEGNKFSSEPYKEDEGF